MEYITSFDALGSFVGKVVEVSFVYNRDSDDNQYYTIQEAIAEGLDKDAELNRRYRGRLGVEYGGTDPEPEYAMHWLEIYENGQLVEERRLADFNIADEEKLIAAQMIWIAE